MATIVIQYKVRPKMDWHGVGHRWTCRSCPDRVGSWDVRSEARKSGKRHHADRHAGEPMRLEFHDLDDCPDEPMGGMADWPTGGAESTSADLGLTQDELRRMLRTALGVCTDPYCC